MARKTQNVSADFVMVNVLYEDGTQQSNRKVPRAQLSGFDDAKEIEEAIAEQDRKIAALSGQPRAPIKTITRIGR